MSAHFRTSQIYISASTRRLLRVIAKSEGADATVDEVGDRLLSEYISSRYPALTPFQKQIETIESEMVSHVKEKG